MGNSKFAVINIDHTRDILDLLGLGKNISDLMQRLSLEFISTQQNSGKNSQNDTNPPICSTDTRINSPCLVCLMDFNIF